MRKIFLILTLALTIISATAFAAEENQPVAAYDYTSETFGFKIKCPNKPIVWVVPKGYFKEPNQQGERLIFANEGAEIIFGYEIILDAFTDNAVPNFNKDSKKIIDEYLKKLKENNPYEIVELVEVHKGNKGVFVVPAEEIEYKNDDGETVSVPVDSPDAITFFRTRSGRCVQIALITNDMNKENLSDYRKSLLTFADATDLAMGDTNSDKKNKKSKKEKKSKK